MLRVIGPNIAIANGTNLLDNNKAPAITSKSFNNGKKYPVAANPPMKVAAVPVTSGCGIKLRKPFRPKTKKITPKRYLTTVAAIRKGLVVNDKDAIIVKIRLVH